MVNPRARARGFFFAGYAIAMGTPLPRGREVAFRALALLGAVAFALLAAEVAVRTFPRLLPGWYRAGFPVGGLEFFYPGVLARTPIDSVPLPYRPDRDRETVGKVPRDLEWMGLVAPGENPDHELYSGIRFRMDRNGFPNPSEMTRADLLLVGDSFAVAAGVLSPEGLQAGLARRLGLAVFNLGIPGIGPAREERLLMDVGLALEPRGVAWLFFGGNDVSDAAALAALKKKGVATYADLFPEHPRPASFLWDLAKRSLAGTERAKTRRPLPPFVFETADGRRWPLWFNPSNLRMLATDLESLRANAGWRTVREVFPRVAAELAERDVRLLVVYVPTKAQVYLPYVAEDAELAHAVASFGKRKPAAEPPAVLWRRVMENRDNVERLLDELCRAEGIRFLSLTPVLRELAQNGELGFLSADTHWNERGQRAAVEPLASWWTESTETAEE